MKNSSSRILFPLFAFTLASLVLAGDMYFSWAILDKRLDANNDSFAFVLLSFNAVAGAVFIAAFGPAWRRRRNLPPPMMRLKYAGSETILRRPSLG